VVVDGIGDEHPAGIGQRFDPRGNVDAVAVDVVVFDDYVAEVDANAELDLLLLRGLGIALGHPLLHFDGAAHCVDHAGKFGQQAVACILYNAPSVTFDFSIDQLREMRLEAIVRSLLVRAHQPRIARHIGGQDRSETSGYGHS